VGEPISTSMGWGGGGGGSARTSMPRGWSMTTTRRPSRWWFLPTLPDAPAGPADRPTCSRSHGRLWRSKYPLFGSESMCLLGPFLGGPKPP
jgi:hypothetical protein